MARGIRFVLSLVCRISLHQTHMMMECVVSEEKNFIGGFDLFCDMNVKKVLVVGKGSGNCVCSIVELRRDQMCLEKAFSIETFLESSSVLF